jgi:hypothetical protein
VSGVSVTVLACCLAVATPPALDPVVLPASGGAGALVGGLAGGGVALTMALVAREATGEEVTDTAQALNRLATFGTLVAPALLSVGGAVVGAGLSSGLVGALTVGFGATMGAAIGTGTALALVPLGVEAVDVPGGPLGATAAIAGIVVGAAAIGAAAAGVVASLTLESAVFDEVGGDSEDFHRQDGDTGSDELHP